jgi:hypothetical protein
LKWASKDAAETYIGLIGKAGKKETPQQDLEAGIAALVEDGLEGLSILNAYAHTRCNFSIFTYDLDNLDAGPDSAVTAELADAVAQDVANDAKVFPPAPPKGKKWPRASFFIGAPSSETPSTTVAP